MWKNWIERIEFHIPSCTIALLNLNQQKRIWGKSQVVKICLSINRHEKKEKRELCTCWHSTESRGISTNLCLKIYTPKSTAIPSSCIILIMKEKIWKWITGMYQNGFKHTSQCTHTHAYTNAHTNTIITPLSFPHWINQAEKTAGKYSLTVTWKSHSSYAYHAHCHPSHDVKPWSISYGEL